MEAQIIKKKKQKKKPFYLKACIHHERFNINFLSDKKNYCKLTATFGKYFMNGTKLP